MKIIIKDFKVVLISENDAENIYLKAQADIAYGMSQRVYEFEYNTYGSAVLTLFLNDQ